MKKSELRQIIREEIQNLILSEAKDEFIPKTFLRNRSFHLYSKKEIEGLKKQSVKTIKLYGEYVYRLGQFINTYPRFIKNDRLYDLYAVYIYKINPKWLVTINSINKALDKGGIHVATRNKEVLGIISLIK